MAGSLYMLRDFFRTGRKPNGSYMGENEDMLNATQRNLSTLTAVELGALRDSAEIFINAINDEWSDRIQEEEWNAQ